MVWDCFIVLVLVVYNVWLLGFLYYGRSSLFTISKGSFDVVLLSALCRMLLFFVEVCCHDEKFLFVFHSLWLMPGIMDGLSF